MRLHFGVVGLLAFTVSGCIGGPLRTAKGEQELFEASVAKCESLGIARGSKKLSRCAREVYEAWRAEDEAAYARALAEGKAAYKEFLSETKEPVPPPVATECGALRDGTFSCAGM